MRRQLGLRKHVAEGIAQAAAGRIDMTLTALEALGDGEVRLGVCPRGAESVASCAGEMAMTAKAAELAAAAGELAAPSLIHWRITSMVDCGSAGAPNGICTPTMPAAPSSFRTR